MAPETKYLCPFSGLPLEFKTFSNGLTVVSSPHGWISKPFVSVRTAKVWVSKDLSPEGEVIEEPHVRGGSWFVPAGRFWRGKPQHFRETAEWWLKHRPGKDPGVRPGISMQRDRTPEDNVFEGEEAPSDSEVEDLMERMYEDA